MAYSVIYGAYSSTWYPSGSSVARKVRSRMYYQVTETETTYTIQFYGQGSLYKDNVGTTIHGKLYNAGTQIGSTGTKTYTYSSSGTNHTDVYYKLVSTQTVTINKTAAKQTRTISHKVYRDGAESSTYSTASVTLTIPALITYAVTYDANGGESAPANQQKIHNTALTLQSAVPTRTGYTFVEWNTAADGSGTSYDPGDSYTANEALALYAQWTPNTYTVAYHKNNASASGSTANSTFTYDTSGTLRSSGFTSSDYLFVGWAKSATGAVAYEAGQSVLNLAASGTVDLYAVWKYIYEAPDIQTVLAYRSTAQGVTDDAGDAAVIAASVIPGNKYSNLSTKAAVSTQVKVEYRLAGGSTWTQLGSVQTITAASTLTWVSSANTFDVTKQYDIRVTASVIVSNVTKIYSTNSTIVSVAEFILDFDDDGDTIGIFMVAPGTTGDKFVAVEGDNVFYLDDSAASGTDYDILTELSALGWDVTP